MGDKVGDGIYWEWCAGSSGLPCPLYSWSSGKVEKVNTKRNPEGMKRVAPETLNADAFGVAEGSIANFERVWQERFKPGIETDDAQHIHPPEKMLPRTHPFS